MKNEKLVFEIGSPGSEGYVLPECDVPAGNIEELIPGKFLRQSAPLLPEVGEADAIRHFTALSLRNYGVDTGFYPLGSCTMKYNPKVNEDIARFSGFAGMHPYQPEELAQGCLELMYRLERMLAEITGMDAISLQPAAGAHGELTGLMVMKAWHEYRGDSLRRRVIVPDSAHGTNPASAAEAGFEVVEVKSDSRGCVDLDSLRQLADGGIAGLMLTNPNTLGLFEENIEEISGIIHDCGGLLYYDGANANAIMGIARPGDMGFDVVHLNLHKTFGTPHGGGGPGSGPVGVKKDLAQFLPVPAVKYENGIYSFDYDRPLSIGKVKSFYGNFGVMVRAYSYIMSLGPEGLKKASEAAVLNANYVMHKLKGYYNVPYERTCMHEVVLSCLDKKEKFGVSAMDVAKRLMDFGIHPPTVYFPLIVKEALMIEPTETASKELLDEFIRAMIAIADEAENNPENVRNAPHNTVIARPDEARAARSPVLRWTP